MAKKNEKALQVWKFSKSQIALLVDQAKVHMKEFEPFRMYQADAQSELLNSFRDELKIPQGMPLNVDLETLQFTERRDNVVPIRPVVPEPEAE